MGDEPRIMAPVTDAAVRTYHLDEAVRCSYAHPVLGEIVCEFPAGDVQPKSEGEELVLEHQLCPIGLATVVDEGIAPWGLSAGKYDAGDVTVAAGPDEDEASDDEPHTKRRARRPASTPEGDA